MRTEALANLARRGAPPLGRARLLALLAVSLVLLSAPGLGFAQENEDRESGRGRLSSVEDLDRPRVIDSPVDVESPADPVGPDDPSSNLVPAAGASSPG